MAGALLSQLRIALLQLLLLRVVLRHKPVNPAARVLASSMHLDAHFVDCGHMMT